MLVYLFLHYSSLSGSGVSVTFFIMFPNVFFVKWYTINTVFLLIVHSPVCFIDIISAIIKMLCCCVLLLLFSVWMLFNWSLWMWVLFICVWFSICFRMSSRRSVTMCLSNWSQRYYSDVVCVGFTCLLFLVISHLSLLHI